MMIQNQYWLRLYLSHIVHTQSIYLVPNVIEETCVWYYYAILNNNNKIYLQSSGGVNIFFEFSN